MRSGFDFAKTFDAEARRYAILANRGQFGPRTKGNLQAFAKRFNTPRSYASTDELQNEDPKAATSRDWAFGFDVFHFNTVAYDDKQNTQRNEEYKYTQLEFARLLGNWIRPAAVFTAARRHLPVVYDEIHLRQRLQVRMKGKDNPEIKFVKRLGHENVLQFMALYLEAAKREVLFRSYPSQIAIPTPEGLLLGRIEEGKAPNDHLPPFTAKGYFGFRRPSDYSPENYNHHLVIKTFIDYDGLDVPKEDVYNYLDHYGQSDESRDAADTLINRRFLAVTPGAEIDLSQASPSVRLPGNRKIFGMGSLELEKVASDLFDREAVSKELSRGLSTLTELAETALARLQR